ncbi:hypothetical protein NFI96_012073 [Prochilodus magdalenae]|nr:hypothetical protein NFI96_012073 [Prochilodus magdalenae]
MNKQVTLATCIAKMYEGGKLDSSGATAGTPKKANPTLLGTLGNVEYKLNLLEGKVEQIANTQAILLQKLDLVSQGMEALEKNLVQFKQDTLERSVVKPTQKDVRQASSEVAEVRSLCEETVTLLKNLNQEGQVQRKKIEGIESSVFTLDKVLAFVGEAFRSSKIVEFILNGVVPWRKQGLLDTAEEEKEIPDKSTAKVKVPFCNQETQTPEENNEETAVLYNHEGQELTYLSSASLPLTGPEEASHGPEEEEMHQNQEAPETPLETLSMPTLSQLERWTEAQQQLSLHFSPQEELKQDLDGEQWKADFPGEPRLATKQLMPIKKNLETDPQQKDTLALATLKSIIAEREPESELLTQKTNTEDSDRVLEKPVTYQNKSDLAKESSILQSETSSVLQSGMSAILQSGTNAILQSETSPAAQRGTSPTQETGMSPVLQSETTNFLQCGAKSAVLSKKSELQLLIIDDCPPCPAPFEHRIVSAKQVPMGSYYEVKPNEVLGGGRFGQVHKCAELSSGLTLAAKFIKVKGMKERKSPSVELASLQSIKSGIENPGQDEVKNEIGVMNQLNHVNLIQLYDAFESRTNLILIMEYVEGGELFDRIVDEHYQLTELDAIVFTRQICEGVQYLHQQYILHLDLKPENILCVSSTGNQIKIIDFGLARKYRPREKLKVNFGTPEFLAPEVVNYEFVSFPTDMWSVGVITYMLLSGLSPFLGESDTETMNNILHANWDFDVEAFENVSIEAKDFISRLLIPSKCSRLSASGCMKHSWLNNLEDKAKQNRVRLKSQLRLQSYLAAHRQWKVHETLLCCGSSKSAKEVPAEQVCQHAIRHKESKPPQWKITLWGKCF